MRKGCVNYPSCVGIYGNQETSGFSQESKREPIDVWKASDCAFLEFSSVVRLNPSSHSSRPLNEGAWTPPPNEWIKANCDASWISCSQIAEDYVESDNKSLIHRLNNKSFSDWKSASIERDICSLTPFFENVIFSFVRRSCNKVADWVARAARLNYCPRNWTIFLPPSLVGLMCFNIFLIYNTGNPRVTPEVTRDVCLLARMMAVNLYYSQIEDLIFELSMWRCSDELRVRADKLHRSSRRYAKHYIACSKDLNVDFM
ncbi:hypothetical protein GQ457_08G006710 [Hibiscus cannabinus]